MYNVKALITTFLDFRIIINIIFGRYFFMTRSCGKLYNITSSSTVSIGIRINSGGSCRLLIQPGQPVQGRTGQGGYVRFMPKIKHY